MTTDRVYQILILALLVALAPARAGIYEQNIGGRAVLVYVPASLPPAGQRSLVVVLHGGLGNAQRIATEKSEAALNLNAVAEQNGFIVAYLNGTPVTRILGDDKLGWNAGGGCCGRSAADNVDDVAYIQGVIASLNARYGVNPQQVYGMGHSNGAMMIQRLICETTLLAAAVAISGPLNDPVSSCPGARGRRILAIHGAQDRNVPVAGGRGSEGLSRVAYASEAHSRQVLTASGALYTLQIIAGADHVRDHLEAAVEQTEGQSIQQKAARFFGFVK
jgi:polyhydroxybutyrate depolymerase